MSEYPAIALRQDVFFPHNKSEIAIDRQASRKALQEAMQKDKILVLLTQKNPALDFPGPQDVYPIGVKVRVNQVLRLTHQPIHLEIEILERAVVKDFLLTEDYLRVTLEDIAIYAKKKGASSIDIQTTTDAATTSFKEFLAKCGIEESFIPEGGKELPVDALFTLFGHLLRRFLVFTQEFMPEIPFEPSQSEMEIFLDQVAHRMPWQKEIKLMLLEQLSFPHRLILACQNLYKNIFVLELDAKLRIETHQAIDARQREQYLREYMEYMQEQLGTKGDNKEDEYLTKLESLPLAEEHKEKLRQEILRLRRLPAGVPEEGVIENYLGWVFSLPWEDPEHRKIDLSVAEEVLNRDHYALDEVKERILEYIAVLQLTDRLKGQIICLVGPPGVGKTSLAKSIAEALERPFISSSLGGVRDEAEIRGHRRTYVASMPGRIIQALRLVKSRNPLFLLDEIDKMSSDFRGDPAAALLEVLDPEQNSHFTDHYLDLPFDLSQVIFITTANTTYSIPPALVDRMEIIEISGYTDYEKLEIAKRHLVPRIRAEHGLKAREITFADKALMTLIQDYTAEAGVRDLQRLIARIMRKVAKEIVAGERKSASISHSALLRYLGEAPYPGEKAASKSLVGQATGLAWTPNGGALLPIEVRLYPGNGKLDLTGNLGEVMKESAQAAWTYVRSQVSDPEMWKNKDLHVHVPQGAIPKDGPSAGATIAAAIYSAITGRPMRPYCALSGEITLSGRILPVGGLKEKLLAAIRGGVQEVFLPLDNKPGVQRLDDQILSQIKLHFIADMEELLTKVLEKEK